MIKNFFFFLEPDIQHCKYDQKTDKHWLQHECASNATQMFSQPTWCGDEATVRVPLQKNVFGQ